MQGGGWAQGSQDRDPAEAKAEGGQTADSTGLADAQSTEGLERHAGREGKGRANQIEKCLKIHPDTYYLVIQLRIFFKKLKGKLLIRIDNAVPRISGSTGKHPTTRCGILL